MSSAGTYKALHLERSPQQGYGLGSKKTEPSPSRRCLAGSLSFPIALGSCDAQRPIAFGIFGRGEAAHACHGSKPTPIPPAGGSTAFTRARDSQWRKTVAKKPPVYEPVPRICVPGGGGEAQAVMKPACPVRIIHVRLWEGQER